YMKYKTPEFVRKKGVVLSHELVPYGSALTFNAGVLRKKDGYVMLFRNDYGFSKKDFDDFYAGISDNTTPKTNLGAAVSEDGLHWKVLPEPVFSLIGNGISRAYDPRITSFGNGQYGVCFAVDTDGGIRGGIAVTEDFEHFEIKSISLPENRNMVLLPEKINGEYVRLERPFLVNDRNHSIWLSRSPDLIHWGESELVLDLPRLPYANLKIGPGAPPVKTPQGWLTLIHGVEVQEQNFNAWHRNWNRCYYGGIMLLDLENPAKIVALADKPLLVPEEKYELEGFRGGVIFPGGLVAEPDGTAKIYYGAADTVECLAEAKIDDLIKFCFSNNVIKPNGGSK
ncbi:MAG: glycoside hydrolase family 130 protein, partial [Lentisphaeria bacterium]|nr:glycoside hydrolase family 130 protein [Lentisphaeria bacterium]